MPAAVNALIVEDDPVIGQFIAYILDSEGFSSEIFTRGEDVPFPMSCRIVVVDLVLPGMSGLAFAEKVRETCQETPLIFITGTTDPYNIRLMLGYTNYIVTKPFTDAKVGDLRRTVQAIKSERV